MRKIDLTGQRFERLTVIKEAPKRKKSSMWLCKCDCGNSSVVSVSDLRRGHTKSCGCLRADMNTIHGVYNTRLYRIWHEMQRRCNDHNKAAYKRYGGRGISVCDEWDDPKVFYDWAMANGYKKGLQIDRINNDGDYEPNNYQWVTAKENCNNRQTNVTVELDGQTKTVMEWSRITGIPHSTIRGRIKAGKSPEEILKTK